jgi:hypothetical protein
MIDITQFKQIVTSIENNNLTIVLVKRHGSLNDKQLDEKLFDLTTKGHIPFFIVSNNTNDHNQVYFFEKNNTTFIKKVDLQIVCDNFNLQMPPVTQLAKNVINQAIDTVKTAITTGQIFTLFEDLQNRLKVCNQCEFLIEKRCQKCGCYMEYKAKLISAVCPIGLWHK